MKKVLADVDPQFQFWLNNGSTVKNLHELAGALKEMNEGVFNHHVNEERNDFYNWVKDVHQDAKLAQQLLNVKNQLEAAEIVSSRIEELKTVKAKPKKKTVRKVKKDKTVKKKNLEDRVIENKVVKKRARRAKKVKELKPKAMKQSTFTKQEVLDKFKGAYK